MTESRQWCYFDVAPTRMERGHARNKTTWLRAEAQLVATRLALLGRSGSGPWRRGHSQASCLACEIRFRILGRNSATNLWDSNTASRSNRIDRTWVMNISDYALSVGLIS